MLGDLGKSLSSQRFGLYGQSSSLIVIEAHSPATELFSKDPILLAKIFNDLQLAVLHPPRRRRSAKTGMGRALSAYSKPIIATAERSSEISHLRADPVFGPYAAWGSIFGSHRNESQAGTGGRIIGEPQVFFSMLENSPP